MSTIDDTRMPDGTAVTWIDAVTLHRQDGDTLDVLTTEHGDVVLNRITADGTHHPVVMDPDQTKAVADLLSGAAAEAREAQQ